MSLPLPTNATFACAKHALIGMKALILPASDELVTMQGAPIGRLFNVTFDQLRPELEDGDAIVNEADAADVYRIRGVKHLRTPLAAHSHCLAERGGVR